MLKIYFVVCFITVFISNGSTLKLFDFGVIDGKAFLIPCEIYF
jgi:hypothetical protein